MPVKIRPLLSQELDVASDIYRKAFCATLNISDKALGDTEYVRTRYRADPSAALAAELDGAFVGSSFLTQWGSFGLLGPTSVRTDGWSGGAGMLLFAAVLKLGVDRGCRYFGGFTFSNSPPHIDSLRKYDFWPRFLTMILGKGVKKAAAAGSIHTFQGLDTPAREAALLSCRDLTHSLLEGLDLATEIRAVFEQQIGDTVLLLEEGKIAGLAVCHCGAGSEAGSLACHVKFGAVGAGAGAAERFAKLLTACEVLAAQRGCNRLTLGVNTARHEAYRAVLSMGYVVMRVGVALHRPNLPLYSEPHQYVLDDWR